MTSEGVAHSLALIRETRAKAKRTSSHVCANLCKSIIIIRNLSQKAGRKWKKVEIVQSLTEIFWVWV